MKLLHVRAWNLDWPSCVFSRWSHSNFALEWTISHSLWQLDFPHPKAFPPNILLRSFLRPCTLRDWTKGAGETVRMGLGTGWPVMMWAGLHRTMLLNSSNVSNSQFPLPHHNTPICFSLVSDWSRVCPSTLHMEHRFCITLSWHNSKTHTTTREKLKMHYPHNILSVYMSKNSEIRMSEMAPTIPCDPSDTSINTYLCTIIVKSSFPFVILPAQAVTIY